MENNERKITQMMLRIVIKMIMCHSAMGKTDYDHMMEYLDNYSDLDTIPHHEVSYMACELSPDSDIEHACHDFIIKSLADLSKKLPQDSDIVKQIQQYQKQPWTASPHDLNVISKKLADHYSTI
jgi:hypothetical protein